jgi:hypothetical protein
MLYKIVKLAKHQYSHLKWNQNGSYWIICGLNKLIYEKLKECVLSFGKTKKSEKIESQKSMRKEI